MNPKGLNILVDDLLVGGSEFTQIYQILKFKIETIFLCIST